jgi:hypothetical protein
MKLADCPMCGEKLKMPKVVLLTRTAGGRRTICILCSCKTTCYVRADRSEYDGCLMSFRPDGPITVRRVKP